MHKNCLTYPVEFADDAFGESEALAQMLLGGREGADAPRVFIVADQSCSARRASAPRSAGMSAHTA